MNFDPRFYLDFVKDPERMIAYAPSILETDNTDPMVTERMKELISRFRHISVREENGRRYLNDVFVTKALELADPTLLIAPDEWDGALQLPSSGDDHGDRYMLVMFRNPSRSYQDAAATLAARLLLPQIIIPIHESDLKLENAITDSVGPNQFVSLIRNADYICTDSYHGIALALSFQKEFCCFERFTDRKVLQLNDRVRYILDAVGLRSRLYNPETSIEQYITPIDFIPVNYKLSREDIQSMVEAASAEEALQLFGHTWYGKKFNRHKDITLEEFYSINLQELLEREARRHPYSVAILFRYLYSKEQEVRRLTLALEAVRYQMPPEEAMRYIQNT